MMVKKLDFSDLTVLLPVRIDSMIRLENLLTVIKYLQKYFVVDIKVLEASGFDSQILRSLLPNSVDYTYVKDDDPVFYRTRYINQMAQTVKTDYLAVWDADVVFPLKQIAHAMESLRSDDTDFVYPYAGLFFDTSPLIRQMFMEAQEIEILEKLYRYMSLPYGTKMKGGAFLASRKAYMEVGMENENFYGWGPEDWERYDRWKNLGYRVRMIDGVLFHLTHPRDMNGQHNSEEQRKSSTCEKERVALSCEAEIRQHLNLEM